MKNIFRVMLVLAVVFAAPYSFAFAAGPREDFYEYVNGAWLADTVIRPDRWRAAAFEDVSDEVEKILREEMKTLAASRDSAGDPLMDMAVEYYGQSLNIAKRDREGFEPARRDYERIENLASLKDLSAAAASMTLDGFPLPFGVYVWKDFEDVTKYVVCVSMPNTFLGDPSYYEEGNETGARLKPLVGELLTKLFLLSGSSPEDAGLEIQRAMAFDALLAKYVPDAEARTYDKTYFNPSVYREFTAKIKSLDFGALIERLILARPEVINIDDKAYFDAFDEIYSESNFQGIKSWMKASFLMKAAGKLSREFLMANLRYSAAVSGASSSTPLEEIPLVHAEQLFSEAIGIYFGKKYLGPDTKDDVEKIAREEANIYRGRLEKNDWLGEETRRTAIRKLDAINIRVGYPDKPNPVYKNYQIIPFSKGATLYSNYRLLSKVIIRHNFSLYGTVPDKTLWGMAAYETNAYYNGADNSITFPAGILRPPFYSAENTDIANIGAIGMIIAHEISHAFDKNGALRDENGNMRQWWTESDYAEFEKRTAAMASLFNGIKVDGGAVNGEITLAENIADAGGLSCALETAAGRVAVKKLSQSEYDEFFRAYAVIWRSKTRSEMEELLLLQDTHAPAKLRVNVQLSNLNEFYDTYEAQPGDGMYIPPERRVKIW